MGKELIPAIAYLVRNGVPARIVVDENRKIKKEDYEIFATAVMLFRMSKYKFCYVISPEEYQRITGGD